MSTLDELAPIAARLRGIFCDIDDTLTHAGAVVSTVHAHAMAGNWDKAAALRVLTAGLWGEELDVTRGEYLFIGDSPNDQACFAYFPISAGVANAKKFALDPPPSFFAAREG